MQAKQSMRNWKLLSSWCLLNLSCKQDVLQTCARDAWTGISFPGSFPSSVSKQRINIHFKLIRHGENTCWLYLEIPHCNEIYIWEFTLLTIQKLNFSPLVDIKIVPFKLSLRFVTVRLIFEVSNFFFCRLHLFTQQDCEVKRKG